MRTVPVIQMIGSINEEAFASFSKKLRKYERNQSIKEVLIELSSEGGSAYDALAFFDRIRGTRLSVTITATGLVASAAVLVFMAGDKTRMTPSAWLMVHEDTVGGLKNKKVHEIEKEVGHSRRLENQWCELLASVSHVSFEAWVDLHRSETYLNQEECRNLGLLCE